MNKLNKNLTIEQMTELVMELAKEKKFGNSPTWSNLCEKTSLIHSEVSEAFEAYRHKKIKGKHGFNEEVADVLIRVLHLCGIYKIDIEKELLKKMHFNQKRSWDWKKLNEKHTE